MKTSEVIGLLQQHMGEHGDRELEIDVVEPGGSDENLCTAIPVGVDVFDDGESPVTNVLMTKAAGVSVFWENTYEPSDPEDGPMGCDFSTAAIAARLGAEIAREGWVDNDLYLKWDEAQEQLIFYTPDGDHPWIPLQPDVLATDWIELVEIGEDETPES